MSLSSDKGDLLQTDCLSCQQRSCSVSGTIVRPWYILNYILQDSRLSQLIERWELDLGEKATRRITWDAGAFSSGTDPQAETQFHLCPLRRFWLRSGSRTLRLNDSDLGRGWELSRWTNLLIQTSSDQTPVLFRISSVETGWWFGIFLLPSRWTPDLGVTEILDFIAGLIPSQLRS